MDHFAGLDVSVKETSVCILDDAGRIVKEVKVASEPQALQIELENPSHALALLRPRRDLMSTTLSPLNSPRRPRCLMVRSLYQPKAKPAVSIAFLNTPSQILYI